MNFKKIFYIFFFMAILCISISSCKTKTSTNNLKETEITKKLPADSKNQLLSLNGFTFEIPKAWAKNEKYSQKNANLFTQTDAKIENLPSNVSLLIENTNKKTIINPTEQNVLDIVKKNAPKATNITFQKFFNTKLGTCYEVSYIIKKDREVLSDVKQTQFGLFLDNYTVEIFATDFGDNINPSSYEVGKNLILSLSK